MLGADKGYDSFDFVELMRELDVTPHVTQNLTRRGGSAIDGRATHHAGFATSQHARPRIEPAFGAHEIPRKIACVCRPSVARLDEQPVLDWIACGQRSRFRTLAQK
jgi:hypothetical protein